MYRHTHVGLPGGSSYTPVVPIATVRETHSPYVPDTPGGGTGAQDETEKHEVLPRTECLCVPGISTVRYVVGGGARREANPGRHQRYLLVNKDAACMHACMSTSKHSSSVEPLPCL